MKQNMNMGGSIVSMNILEKKGRMKWCFREESVLNIIIFVIHYFKVIVHMNV